MPSYRFLFRLGPPGYFGLPEGDKIVVPAQPAGRQIVSAVLDTRTGQLVSHGTLSQYRAPDHALAAKIKPQGFSLSITDNFLEVVTEAERAQPAADRVLAYVDLLLQSLTTMYGDRFFASLLSAEDAQGVPQAVQTGPKTVQLFQATFFNIEELHDRVARAVEWATIADAAAKKALFYFEHACLLNEFAQTLPPTSPHAAFSRALAFLQLFKALTSIVGDPSSDHDYQSRCRRLDLARDFWQTKARPLYDIRNEEDVAHYSHTLPEPGAFLAKYLQAVSVFREALEAHMKAMSSASPSG
jgi:hypothetical protein